MAARLTGGPISVVGWDRVKTRPPRTLTGTLTGSLSGATTELRGAPPLGGVRVLMG